MCIKEIFKEYIQWFRLLIVCLYWLFCSSELTAQPKFLIADGSIQTIPALEERYQDFKVPDAPNFDQIILEAEGADGGWIEYSYADRFNTKRTRRINGGEGATMSATYTVGQFGQQIPPGATLRFILGNRGHRAKFDLLESGNFGAGGGGGSAVLLSKDDGTTWLLLMVAGGGGGAGASILEDQREKEFYPGQPGASEQNGLGGNHRNYIMAEAGVKSMGGNSHEQTGGGGGAFGNGQHEAGKLYYGNAGWKDHKLSEPPLGGLGGTQKDCYNGGWGFGGGGSGKEGGGGGGGYSGGSAGLDGFGGGGGGSHVETMFIRPSNVSKIQNEDTDNPGDGFVRYKFITNGNQ